MAAARAPNSRWPAVAWTVAAGEVALFALFTVIYLTPITPAVVFREAGGLTTLLFVLPFSALAAAGGLVAARRPENLVGWLVLGGVAGIAIGSFTDLIGSLLIHAHLAAGSWVALGGVLWVSGVTPGTACFVTAILVFPDGQLRSRRLRWMVGTTVVLAVLTVAFGLVDPSRGAFGIGYSSDFAVNATSPLAVAGLAGVVNAYITFSTVAGYVLEVSAFLLVFLRLRGADADERHQIKWFAAGAITTIVCNVIPAFMPPPTSTNALVPAIVGACGLIGGLALPVGIAVAMLKYHLYDIDVIISRALVYGSLAVLITAVYVGIAVGIGTLVGSGGKPNLALSILATAIVAVGFQPVRERVQRLANRLVYGRRATPYEVLSEFSGRVAESYAADQVLPRMAQVLREGTGAESATVWLRANAELRPAATFPDGSGFHGPLVIPNGTLPAVPGATRAVEVRHQGELLGALSVSKRRGEALTPIEGKLVDDLAHQAGLVLKNVGLSADLQARLDDLRASRQRLVSAQDMERRRLERNLHDGAQQHLVALKVKLGLAEMLVSRDPAKAAATLEQLKGDADEALETLRDLARGIYPPLLANKGLVVALESQARKATLPVRVEAQGVERYAQDVEATVYFCVLEALQNVQKYAAASEVVVRLHEGDGTLVFEVADDGAGFDPRTVRTGAGLTNMHDRMDALGGSVHVSSQPGAGTCVCGALPLPTHEPARV
jgi:signal transduction histidine kinase